MDTVSALALELYKYAAYSVVFILAAIRAGGIHFIFLFFVKMLRLNFCNKNLRAKSDEYYDIKLFKFFTGIQARSLKDVSFIQDCINKGKIKSIEFIFSGFFGFAGSKKSNKIDLIAIIFIVGGSALLCYLTASQSSVYKKDYAIYQFKDGTRYYINEDRILESKSGSEINCGEIDKYSDNQKKYVNEICPYLTVNDQKLKKAVLKGIEINNLDRMTFTILSIAFLFTCMILVVGFVNFNISSGKLRKLKLEEMKSQHNKNLDLL
jgi:hypothetical protein